MYVRNNYVICIVQWLLTIKLVGVQITGQLALLPLLLFNVWLCLQGVV